MRKSKFALRLQPSLLEEARKLAQAEGVALNQLINAAVAEKLSALRTESYFAERARRASVPKALKILKRATDEGRSDEAKTDAALKATFTRRSRILGRFARDDITRAVIDAHT
jgi:hypothetical protein